MSGALNRIWLIVALVGLASWKTGGTARVRSADVASAVLGSTIGGAPLLGGDHCADCEVTAGPIYNGDLGVYVWSIETGGPCGEGLPDCIDCNKMEGLISQCFHNEFFAFSVDSTSPCDEEFCEDVGRWAEQASSAFDAGDDATMVRLLTTPGTPLRLNAARGAIQEIDCRGRIGLHLQLTPRAYASLSVLLERTQHAPPALETPRNEHGGGRPVRAGDLVAYEAREPHGMRAVEEPLVLAAVIAPRPAAR